MRKLTEQQYRDLKWEEFSGWQFDVSKPSGRIWHALAAMRWFEKTPGFAIDMSTFGQVRRRNAAGETCFACCGGAAACALEGVYNESSFRHSRYSGSVQYYETSLDCARSGLISQMFHRMGMPAHCPRREFDRPIHPCRDSPKKFYADMNRLASDLQAAGY